MNAWQKTSDMGNGIVDSVTGIQSDRGTSEQDDTPRVKKQEGETSVIAADEDAEEEGGGLVMSPAPHSQPE
jgi:hypothetical protein